MLVLFTLNFWSFMFNEKSYRSESFLKGLNTAEGLLHLAEEK